MHASGLRGFVRCLAVATAPARATRCLKQYFCVKTTIPSRRWPMMTFASIWRQRTTFLLRSTTRWGVCLDFCVVVTDKPSRAYVLSSPHPQRFFSIVFFYQGIYESEVSILATKITSYRAFCFLINVRRVAVRGRSEYIPGHQHMHSQMHTYSRQPGVSKLTGSGKLVFIPQRSREEGGELCSMM